MTPENEMAAPGQESRGDQIAAQRDGDDFERSRIEQLRGYLRRGWALVPLHSVDPATGACSCWAGAYPEHKSAGKHPVAAAWQRPEHLVLTEAALFSVLESRPRCNWGLATGLLSGVWAIDYDPAAVLAPEREVAEAFLLQLVAVGTWTQRTGSGGQHWLFTLPADFVPNNSAGRLPSGFDVRGARAGKPTGGQIVLAPSVSGVGAYEVLGDPAAPVLPAPAAVLELLRPPPPRKSAPATTFTAAAGDTAGSYVVAGISGELAQLRATPTRRNDRAWRAAARVQELMNTGLVDREAAYAAWWAAAAAHPDPSVRVPDRELLSVWASAERTVGDRPADLSGVGGPSGWGGTPILPFAAAGAAPPLGGSGPGAESRPAPAGPMGPSGTGVGPESYPQPVDDAADRLESEVQRQLLQMQARREAQRRLDETALGDRETAVAELMGQMLDSAGLDGIAPLEPLIEGFLYRDTFARVIGASGSGKTFVTLDMAAAVATGRAWCGRRVAQGGVVYMVAEGAGGIRKRVRAWEQEHGTKMSGVRFLGLPVQAQGAEWDVFVEVCRRLAPSLVVIDTQARVTVGVDENSATEMGVFVDAAERLRQATGACVLLVHHKGLSGEHGRGSTAVKAALQTELSVERKAGLVTLSTDKQKDDAEAGPVAFRLSPVQLDGTDGTADETSAVLRLLDVQPGRTAVSDAELTGHLADMAMIAAEVFAGSAGGTKAEFRSVVMTERKVVTVKSTFYRLWSTMISRKIIGKIHGSQSWRYIPPEAREELIEPLPGGDPDEGGYYAP